MSQNESPLPTHRTTGKDVGVPYGNFSLGTLFVVHVDLIPVYYGKFDAACFEAHRGTPLLLLHDIYMHNPVWTMMKVLAPAGVGWVANHHVCLMECKL